MPTMKMRADYEFATAIRVLTGMPSDNARVLANKIDTSAPKHTVTGDEVSRFMKASAEGSKRYTADERKAAPQIAFLKKALAVDPKHEVSIKVEDMSKLKVPKQIPLAKIRGDLTLDTRQVIRDVGENDAILDSDTPVAKLHAFAKSISKDGVHLTLADVLHAQRDDKRSFDSYKQCNALLEKYFVGKSVDQGDEKKPVFKSAHMSVVSETERSYDTYDKRLDVNLRPNITVTAKPGDYVIMQSSLRHSEPEVAQATADRPSVRFPWWGDSNVPSTMTIVIARPGADGEAPEIVESVKLRIPVNVAHVKAAAAKTGDA